MRRLARMYQETSAASSKPRRTVPLQRSAFDATCRGEIRRISGLMCLGLVAGAMGCVSQADYDQLAALNRSLLSEKEGAEQRALDAEAQADAMRRQMRLKEGEVDMQKSLLSNLKSENDRLGSAFDQQGRLMEKIDLNPPRPVVIERALPPELDAALQQFAAAHPEAVEYDPARGLVKWKADLLFSSGSDVIRDDAKSTLRAFADVVNSPACAPFEIVVVGHTDTDPIKHAASRGHPTNWHLSSHRAIAVAMELLAFQISPQRIGVMGYGEYRPVSTNDTPDGKTLNRRVEIFIVGHEGAVSSSASGAAQSMPPQK